MFRFRRFNAARFLARRDHWLSDDDGAKLRREGASASGGNQQTEAAEGLPEAHLPAGWRCVGDRGKAKVDGDGEDKGAGAKPDWRIGGGQQPDRRAGNGRGRQPKDPTIALERQEGFQGAARRKRGPRATTPAL